MAKLIDPIDNRSTHTAVLGKKKLFLCEKDENNKSRINNSILIKLRMVKLLFMGALKLP